jgi:hypothetical protein
MRDVARTTIIVGIAALGVGLCVATALTVAPRSAEALPAYAQKEGKACGFCHVNPAGGGARNGRGNAYAANGHSFKKK